MADHARSTDPRVQAQLDRLWALSPGADVLGLDRITRLLERLGDPQRSLPPVLHVAGTNGKGSTCAFLRAGLEADGRRVHVYSSPHLVRFNERIRLSGTLIDDAALAALLGEVLDHADGIGASFFEVTTAAAFLAFSRVPADACVIEVGLGGRLDATNVLPAPAAAAIAQLGVDHEAFLGADPVGIAGEKAGIAKPAAPLVTMRYPAAEEARIAAVAEAAGATLVRAGREWHWRVEGDGVVYEDRHGRVALPRPSLPGAHQSGNLALAVATLRHARLPCPAPAALAEGAQAVRWPARMQRLGDGPLTRLLPGDGELWLDGGHNRAAAAAVRDAVAGEARGRPLVVIAGMLANKDADGLLAALAPLAGCVIGVPVPHHEHHPPAEIARVAAARGAPRTGTAADVASALLALGGGAPPVVLVVGSLYLAGEVLAANDELPE